MRALGAGIVEGVRSGGMIIAIDGPAASGKGTHRPRACRPSPACRISTPACSIAASAPPRWRAGPGFDDVPAPCRPRAHGLDLAALDEEALKAGPVGEAASRVAAVPQVRAALLKLQRDFARQPGGAVLDGRDIGTVIAPRRR